MLPIERPESTGVGELFHCTGHGVGALHLVAPQSRVYLCHSL